MVLDNVTDVKQTVSPDNTRYHGLLKIVTF